MLTAIDRFSKFPSVKVTKSTGEKSTIKFLRSYIDTHGIPESIKTDQLSGFKGKAMKKFCLENNIEQKFCPVGDHRGCGLVERTIRTIKRRLGVMLLEENVKSIKLCLSTIIRDMRWIKQKTIQKLPFEAHFGRLPKTEFKIIRDNFVEFSDHLDKQHLERSALTANQLKKRIDQSRGSLKIVKKGQKSRDVSPLFKQVSMSTQERNRARTLRNLLEANANRNAEWRRYDGPSLTQLVDTTSIIDPELGKELLYSWEKGFVEDKPKGSEWNSHNLSRRDETRKSGAAMTKPFKGKIAFDSPKTVTTAAGAVYRKSDLVTIPSSPTKIPKDGTNQKEKAKSPLEEPKNKHQKKDDELFEDTISEEEEWNIPREQVQDLFQDSETVVTSRDTPVGGGLNLAIKRAKPNLGGPKTVGLKTQEQVALNPIGDPQDKRVRTLISKGKVDKKKAAVTAEEVTDPGQSETVDLTDQPCGSNTKARQSKKRITRDTSPSSILDAFQKQDMGDEEWQSLADQVLTRGLQRTADEIIRSRTDNQTETAGEQGFPSGISDDSVVDEQGSASVRRSKRTTKNQEPKKLGGPVKHSVKYISADEEADINEMALEQYRYGLANVKTDKNNPVETRLKLLERHLFRKKFGYTALDTTHSWSTQWKVPLEVKKHSK